MCPAPGRPGAPRRRCPRTAGSRRRSPGRGAAPGGIAPGVSPRVPPSLPRPRLPAANIPLRPSPGAPAAAARRERQSERRSGRVRCAGCCTRVVVCPGGTGCLKRGVYKGEESRQCLESESFRRRIGCN